MNYLDLNLTFAEMLNSMGKKNTAGSRKLMLDSVEKQVVGNITVGNDQKTYLGGKMHYAFEDREKNTWTMSMNSIFAPFITITDAMPDSNEEKFMPGESVFDQLSDEARESLSAELFKNIDAKHRLAILKTASQRDPRSRPVWPKPVKDVLNRLMAFSIYRIVIGENEVAVPYFLREELISTDGVNVSFTGLPLNRFVLTLYKTILYLVQSLELGGFCRLAQEGLLYLMVPSITEQTVKNLHNAFGILTTNALLISYGKHLYLESLITEAIYCRENDEWLVWLNPELMPLSSGFSPAH